ncbi:MAG: hypothetical protein IJA83_02605 [Clostridia bacterium]|nr:hypothetical protein [Clostridia bacterium]
MKLRKLFALLMTAVMLLGMVPASHAELTDCNHDWDSGQWLSGAPANCQVSKPKTYTCTICKATRTWDEYGPCNYIWSWESHVPSCEEMGRQNGVCSVCGEVTERDTRGPHSWGDWHGTGGTCVNPGRQERTCTVCGATETRTGSGGEHDWGAWKTIKPGTCVESGEEERTCNLCGKTEKRTTGGGGHQYGAWKEVKAPSCTENGREEHYCRYCGRMEWDVIPMVDHSFGEWYVVLEPKVGIPGVEERTCTMCGLPEQREIPGLEEGYIYIPGGTPAPGGVVVPDDSGWVTINPTPTPDPEYVNKNDDPNWNNGTYVPGVTVDLNGLTVTKSAPAGSHAGYYYPGEVVPFTITVTNNTGVELIDVEITDPIKGGNEDAVVDRILSMQPGESATVLFNYTTTEADAAFGTECFWNTAYATGSTLDGTQVSGTSNTVKVLCVMPHEISISKTVSGAPANGEFYVPGETICFIISMSNDTTYPLYVVTLTDPLCEDQYFHDEVNGMSYLYMDNLYNSEDNPLGFSQSARVAPTYVVTEADAEAGFVTNTAIVNYQTWYGENKTASASVTVKCGKASDAVVLEKIDMRSPANGEYYVPGEVIKYGLTVRSTEDNPLQNIIIYDPLKGGDQVVFGPADSWVLGAGFDYTVTEADAQRGYIENTGYATFTYQNTGEDGTVYSNTLTLPCGFVKDAGLSSALSLTKSVTSTPANGSYYVPGETVTYELYVKNSGEPLENLDVSDWMWGDERAWVGSFATGEDVTYPVTHIVTDADARAKHVNNIACATAIDKDGNQITEYSNLVTVPCGFPEGDDPFGIFHSVAVVKTEESLPLNGQFYTEGEVIHYAITYTNDGELPLTDVQVWDVMNVTTPVAHAETLQPGESRVCYYQHTVTAEDVAAGSVMNIAHASYPVPNAAGFANSTSNVVISKTSAYHWVWVTPLFPEDATPEYDPGTGWFPGVITPEGTLPPFGTIDTDQLRSGEDYCERIITGRDNASVSYEVSFCSEHADTQSSALLMQQAAATPELQIQAAAYAVALWRSEVESLYQEIFEAADPTAKTVVTTEYVRFLTDVANYEAMLNALYPEQPALVANTVARLWEDKCVTLCNEIHAAASARKDSLLGVTPTTGAAYTACGCVTTAEAAGSMASKQEYCPLHGFPFSMIDMLLQGQDTAEAWTMVRKIWGVELTSAYNKIYEAMGDNKLLAMAEYNALTQWMMAREASLIALYPDNPEIVVQIMVKTIMERVNDLCQSGK